MLSNSSEKHLNYDSSYFQWYIEAACASHGSVGHKLAEFYSKCKTSSVFPIPQLVTDPQCYLTIHHRVPVDIFLVMLDMRPLEMTVLPMHLLMGQM